MIIWINRAGQQLGTFTLEEVQRRLEQGQFVPTDLAWQEGMPTWKPLSEFPGVTIPPPLERSEPDQPLPVIVPRSDDSGAASSTEVVPVAPGPAPIWENPGDVPMTKAFFTTFREVLFEPGATFARLPLNGKIGRATVFYALIVAFSLLVSILLNLAFLPLSRSLAHTDETGLGFAMPAATLLPLVGFFAFLLAVGGNFVMAGIYHLVLRLLGGARKGYEATYKVVTYSNAATIFSIVPCIGPLVSVLWFLIAGVTGLRRVHETESWKAGLALLAPYLLCLAVGITLMISVLGQTKDLH
jgi:hypothetical protein